MPTAQGGATLSTTHAHVTTTHAKKKPLDYIKKWLGI
jgi:hypothetical protein